MVPIIRVALPQDLATVNRLLGQSFPALLPSHYDEGVLKDALPHLTRVQPKLLSSGTYYIADDTEGQPIGSGGWTRERPGSGEITLGLGHIRHFCTNRKWIHHGVGRAIYVRCEQDARSSGINKFECYSTLNAVPFYESLGFLRNQNVEIPITGNVTLTATLLVKTIQVP